MNKKELINLLKECNAIQFGRFILTSGAVSNYYIDVKKAITNPNILKKIAETMREYVKGYKVIAGMELGAVPLIIALSLETRIPYVIIRKEKKEHGTGKQIEGSDVKGKKVIIIEDVTTSGGSVIKSVNILREYRAIIDKVIVVVDRENGTKEKLQQIGINFIPLLTISDILKNFSPK